MKKIKRYAGSLLVTVMIILMLSGCKNQRLEEKNTDISGENVIITETGEVLTKEQPENDDQPEETPTPEPTLEPTPEAAEIGELGELPPPEVVPEVEISEPEQEQIITEEDQTQPSGKELQIVFLGDSIFDNNRDGTGIPYLTAEQCNADFYNLAIAGTCASIEMDEQYENERWTSRSLVGIVKAMTGEITTGVFEGTRAKELLDNPDIDFSKTDYFVIEYGLNDFFKATPLANEDNEFDFRTYVGALRYAVSNLGSYADDATIILCCPNYAQFFDGNRFIGDGNTLNTGYGTLFDYKGLCQYVANENQLEYLDAYLDLGINGYTAEELLEDGVHLTMKGRQKYADALAHMILTIEETKNN